jgi:hypothetical protein
MKKKLTLTLLLLLSLVSANCFAYEIHKGKLISHKEWTTGKATGSFVHVPMPNLLINRKAGDVFELKLNNYEILPAKGTAGTETLVTGNNYIWFTNASDNTLTYNFELFTCAFTSQRTENCIHIEDTFSVEPGGSFSYSVSPKLAVVFDAPGSYVTYTGGWVYLVDETHQNKNYFNLYNFAASTAEIS